MMNTMKGDSRTTLPNPQPMIHYLVPSIRNTGTLPLQSQNMPNPPAQHHVPQLAPILDHIEIPQYEEEALVGINKETEEKLKSKKSN